METVQRKRIEILADEPLVRLVTDAIDRAGIFGWNVLAVKAGKGDEGLWQEEPLTGADKDLVVAVTTAEKAERLVDELAPILTSHRLTLVISDVQVIRGNRF